MLLRKQVIKFLSVANETFEYGPVLNYHVRSGYLAVSRFSCLIRYFAVISGYACADAIFVDSAFADSVSEPPRTFNNPYQ